MSLMASFVLSAFLRDVLNEIWDMIESVSEGFPTELFNYPIEGATNDPTELSVTFFISFIYFVSFYFFFFCLLYFLHFIFFSVVFLLIIVMHVSNH